MTKILKKRQFTQYSSFIKGQRWFSLCALASQQSSPSTIFYYSLLSPFKKNRQHFQTDGRTRYILCFQCLNSLTVCTTCNVRIWGLFPLRPCGKREILGRPGNYSTPTDSTQMRRQCARKVKVTWWTNHNAGFDGATASCTVWGH